MARQAFAGSLRSEPTHVPALDGLRGIAILLVIPHNSNVYPAVHNWMSPLSAVAHAGWIGVQLFFVLSGFLITRNLLASRGSANFYSVFFGRRALRIFPLYFLVLVFFLIALPFCARLPPEILSTYGAQWSLWVFLSNWTQPTVPPVFWFPHYWSLAIEEQFYLVWPFVTAIAAGRRLVAICALLIGVALLSRVLMLRAGASPQMIYMYTVCRMDALAFGAAVAALASRADFVRRIRSSAAWLELGAVAVLLATAVSSRDYDQGHIVTMTVGYSLVALAFAVLVAVCAVRVPGAGAAWNRLLSLPWLRRVGRYSFGMYVFHMPIALVLQPLLLGPLEAISPAYPVLFSLAVGLLSYAAGMLSFHLFERHFLRLKRHLIANGTGASPPARRVGRST